MAAFYSAVEFIPEAPKTSLYGKIRHRLFDGASFIQRYRNPQYLKDSQEKIKRLLDKHKVTHTHVAHFHSAEMIPPSLASDSVSIHVTDDPSLLCQRDANLSKSRRKATALKKEAKAAIREVKYLFNKGYRLFVV